MVFDNKQEQHGHFAAVASFPAGLRARVSECEQAKGSATCKAAIGAPTFCPHAQRHNTISSLLGLVYFLPKSIFFFKILRHIDRIFRCMHRVLNIDEIKN